MEVKITPTNVVVDAGQQVTLTAEVDEEPENATYLWTRDDDPVATNGDTLTLEGVQTEDAGRYRVVVIAGNVEAPSPPAIVAVRAAVPEWDDSFATGAALALAVALVLVASPLVVALYRLADAADLERDFSALVAIALVLIGAFALAAASYALLLETRGRARRPRRRVIVTKRAPKRGEVQRARLVPGAVTEAVKVLPAALTAFGKLSGYAALLAVTALLFLAGAALGWRATDDDNAGGTAGATTTGATTTATATTGG